jgi:hypothetical protein
MYTPFLRLLDTPIDKRQIKKSRWFTSAATYGYAEHCVNDVRQVPDIPQMTCISNAEVYDEGG